MHPTTNNDPKLTIRDLFAITTVMAILLARAARFRNGIWLVLVPSSFYLAFLLICTLTSRKWVLLVSVAVLHTLVVLMWSLAAHFAYGDIEGTALFAAIVIIDLPLLPLYLAIQPHSLAAIAVSITVGGLLYMAIAYALFRLRRR
jgi:hypothetical protein